MKTTKKILSPPKYTTTILPESQAEFETLNKMTSLMSLVTLIKAYGRTPASQLQSRRAALANAVAQANLAQVNLSASTTAGLTQGAALAATPGATAAISAIPTVPVVSASPVVTSAGQNPLTSNPLAASLAAVAAQTQQQPQQHAANNVALQGLSQ